MYPEAGLPAVADEASYPARVQLASAEIIGHAQRQVIQSCGLLI